MATESTMRAATAIFRRISMACAVLILLAVSSHAQNAQSVNGRWQWKERAVRNKPQRQFTLVIQGTGKTVRGTYSVDEFINGEWQGEDGNQTAFRGQIQGRLIKIEFDPMATVPGYEENVIYKPPADGRKPSAAFLTISGRTLLWRFIAGERIVGVPSSLTLHRDKDGK